MAKKNAFINQSGWIEVICGPMFAGKSEELIRRVNRWSFANIKCLVFKPDVDSRNKDVRSRDGRHIAAITIHDPYDMYKHVDTQRPDLVAIDEVQFFGDEIIEIVQTFADNGINVLVAGLDRDFRGEPFGSIPALLTIAEKVTKLTAICTECGAEASRTQRLINGNPAPYESPLILIGNQESYTARCRHHHSVPNRPVKPETTDFKQKIKTKNLDDCSKS
ncbi:thymidine kinase [Mycoplasmoides alvi]|uniref:thymidine kinase n=1 Tax=Mycoplasmoides alvi TaxID=78580 RepID=UPI00051B47F8|nr:thymidine kinase [Mycoplasmoides alvi]